MLVFTAVVVAAAAATLLLQASTVGAASDTVSVAVSSNALPVPKVASDFASFSYEVPCVPTMMSFGGKPRTSFINLMLNLQEQSGAAGPNIRIGGNSADESVYISPQTPLPSGDKYRISDSDFNAYLAAVPQWKGSITPGVNFRDGNSGALGVAHITALSQIIPFGSGSIVEAIEIG